MALTRQQQKVFPQPDRQWRVSYRVLNKAQWADPLFHQYTVNISGGGICLMFDRQVELNSMVALSLESKLFSSPILALGEVVSSQPGRHGHEIGIEFWWIGWEDHYVQQAIADRIASMISNPDGVRDPSTPGILPGGDFGIPHPQDKPW